MRIFQKLSLLFFFLVFTAPPALAVSVFNDGTTNWVGEIQVTSFAGDLFDSYAVIDLQAGNNWTDMRDELLGLKLVLEDQTGGRPGSIISSAGAAAPSQRFLYLYRSHLQDAFVNYSLFQQTQVNFDAWGQITELSSANPIGGYFCDAAGMNCPTIGGLSASTTDIAFGLLPSGGFPFTQGDVTYDAASNTLSFAADQNLINQGDTTTYWGLSDSAPVFAPHFDHELNGTFGTLQPGNLVPEPSLAVLLGVSLAFSVTFRRTQG